MGITIQPLHQFHQDHMNITMPNVELLPTERDVANKGGYIVFYSELQLIRRPQIQSVCPKYLM